MSKDMKWVLGAVLAHGALQLAAAALRRTDLHLKNRRLEDEATFVREMIEGVKRGEGELCIEGVHAKLTGDMTPFVSEQVSHYKCVIRDSVLKTTKPEVRFGPARDLSVTGCLFLSERDIDRVRRFSRALEGGGE